jgi:ATP-dependent helicase HrpA
LGRGVERQIGHTQPRRIAARTVATRIAEELGTALGDVVGYQVRFASETSDTTRLKVMTDGILLAEIQGDPRLDAYDTIILDEAHERSLNIDFLLGYLKALLPHRPDLRVIVTSATIDTERFSRHFDGAPIIEVSGRTYPVEVRYHPPKKEEGQDIDWPDAVLEALRELHREGPGDTLVFLAGERDIQEVGAHLRRHLRDVEILPLFARLPAKEQMRAFRQGPRRRVVLATNVAETSLTVPGIRYVVDVGLARISRYSGQRKIQRLPIEPISQASADQRAGRCGRVADGICIRLYAQRDYERRDKFTQPQILRTHLAGVILQMKALGLGDIEAFPFVERPRFGMIKDGYEQLYELGAVDAATGLTELGRRLARLPVDPRLGRMLIEADTRDCLPEILVIVAALAIQDPRERPADARDDADAAHRRFQHPTSDFLSYLKLWRAWQELGREAGSSKRRRWCREHHLAPGRMREWDELHRQLRTLGVRAGLRGGRRHAPADALHQTLLAGLLPNIGTRARGHAYAGTRGSTFWLWPGSTLAKQKPRWVMAAERVETRRLHARVCAPIEPKWIEPFAGHLVRKHYSDPHWNGERGYVQAHERVTLYELEIVRKRRVHYGPVHPVHARSIFIRHALVHGRWKTRLPFMRHNQQLLEQFQELGRRLRKRDLLIEADDRFAWFDERVPSDVYSGKQLERWWRQASKDDPRLLYMEEGDLIADPSSLPAAAAFPGHLQIDDARYRLRYRFEPGDRADGVTLQVPLEALPGLDGVLLEWLVPGLLPERIEALLRTLRKDQRKALFPVGETARHLAAAAPQQPEPLCPWLAKQLADRGIRGVRPTDFKPGTLPAPLRINIAVLDVNGRVIDQDRDLAALRKRRFGEAQAAAAAEPPAPLERERVTNWDLGEIPERVLVSRRGHSVNAWPALEDRGTHAALVLRPSPEDAARLHRTGALRLVALAHKRELARLWTRAGVGTELELLYRSLTATQTLAQAIAVRTVERALGPRSLAIRDEASFQAAVSASGPHLSRVHDETLALVRDILTRYGDLIPKLDAAPPEPYEPSIRDMIRQLGRLLPGDVLTSTPWASLQHVPRYLEGIDMRLRKLAQSGLARDQTNMKAFAQHAARYEKRAAEDEQQGRYTPALEAYRWMLEELRISLFAQSLGTALPVSDKRMAKQWDQVVFGR